MSTTVEAIKNAKTEKPASGGVSSMSIVIVIVTVIDVVAAGVTGFAYKKIIWTWRNWWQ